MQRGQRRSSRTSSTCLLVLLVCFLFHLVDSMVYTEPGEATIAKNMPCCRESIGSHVCQEMKQRRPYEFKMRCRTDIDFAVLQCCRSCRTNVPQLGRELFAHGPSSRHCFDRHNRRFCTAFVRKSGMWSSYSDIHSGCNGENAALAFRVCRRSCGFCRVELYKDEEESERCSVRPPTAEPPPAVLTGVVPDRDAQYYLDRVVDEMDDQAIELQK